MSEGFIEFAIYLTYILVVIAALAVIILPLINAFNDLSSLVKVGIGVGVLLVIFGIGYALSGSELIDAAVKQGVTTGQFKFVGGAITAMYILIFAAIIGIIFTEVNKTLK
ncbi:hypothetical protein QQ008_16125 [Fulvivirgaceae bacterium BMA10]|uniref:MotA/TolQ/ExbB proton channel domain-containing protein n=1 Tax=Splendidivirga corallicola TaxID=3051826 RepID=A0ABT8KR64_9BACT|nr:hypothetical protein [Fulvivirgaceae bacterium BMA10]